MSGEQKTSGSNRRSKRSQRSSINRNGGTKPQGRSGHTNRNLSQSHGNNDPTDRAHGGQSHGSHQARGAGHGRGTTGVNSPPAPSIIGAIATANANKDNNLVAILNNVFGASESLTGIQGIDRGAVKQFPGPVAAVQTYPHLVFYEFDTLGERREADLHHTHSWTLQTMLLADEETRSCLKDSVYTTLMKNFGRLFLKYLKHYHKPNDEVYQAVDSALTAYTHDLDNTPTYAGPDNLTAHADPTLLTTTYTTALRRRPQETKLRDILVSAVSEVNFGDAYWASKGMPALWQMLVDVVYHIEAPKITRLELFKIIVLGLRDQTGPLGHFRTSINAYTQQWRTGEEGIVTPMNPLLELTSDEKQRLTSALNSVVFTNLAQIQTHGRLSVLTQLEEPPEVSSFTGSPCTQDAWTVMHDAETYDKEQTLVFSEKRLALNKLHYDTIYPFQLPRSEADVSLPVNTTGTTSISTSEPLQMDTSPPDTEGMDTPEPGSGISMASTDLVSSTIVGEGTGAPLAPTEPAEGKDNAGASGDPASPPPAAAVPSVPAGAATAPPPPPPPPPASGECGEP